ncbi:MAG: dipeptidase [Bacillota bacterium]
MPELPDLQAALALHRRVPVVDGHCDSVLDLWAGKRRLGEASPQGHLDFPRARAGGLSGQVFALWPAPETYDKPSRRVLQLLDALLMELERCPDQARLVTRAEEIEGCRRDGVLAVIVGIEGGEALEGDLALLRTYYRLGVRVLGLTWNHRNLLADGAMEWETGGGLTRFGREVVREMNRLGMVVDGAHLSPAGLRDLLEVSEHPVIVSHGNCRALWDHPRNLTDDQIRALAERGGVFGISFVRAFMGEPGQVTVETVADHIDHVCQLLGTSAHVGLGSDFDGTGELPLGLEGAQALPRLTAELLRRGYREPDLAAILGGNYLRVFRQVLR